MDILYYSLYCKHSQKIIQFLAKGNLTNQLNCICIDRREHDPKTNQTYIVLETGKKVIMPPNVHSVPALLLIKHNYRVILGEEIIQHFQPKVKEQNNSATQFNGEPVGFRFNSSNNGTNIMSEQFTYYNMTPEDLSAKGRGGNRPLYNYVSADQDAMTINTPPDTYHPDKIATNVTVDVLQQNRNTDIQTSQSQVSFM
jgi:hypothetical protein